MATILSRSGASSASAADESEQSEISASADALLTDGVTKELVRWFKLLADETRLKILFLLLEKTELNVRSLCEAMELSQPAVSHHLALLRADGLIECRRDGKHNFYRILPHRFGELLGKMMSAVPGDDSQLQLGPVCVEVTETAPDAGVRAST